MKSTEKRGLRRGLVGQYVSVLIDPLNDPPRIDAEALKAELVRVALGIANETINQLEQLEAAEDAAEAQARVQAAQAKQTQADDAKNPAVSEVEPH